MAHITTGVDRVLQTVTTSGTTAAFSGFTTIPGFRTLTSVLANNDTCDYMAEAGNGDWEQGKGTWSTTGPELARTTVVRSSNSNMAVNFATGTTKSVYICRPSERDADGAVVLGDTLYGNSTPRLARLAGNTTTTKKFYSQTGTGSVSAVPSWVTIAHSDLTGTLAVSGGGTGQTVQTFCSVFNSATITLNDATDTLITFNSEETDPQGLHSTSTNTERISVSQAGTYLAIGYLVFEDLDAGTRAILTLQKNGSANLARMDILSSTTHPAFIVSDIVPLVANDYINLRAYQDSPGGNNKGVYVDAPTSTYPRLKLWRLGD